MILKAASHANDYRSGIRNAIRGLWRGAIDRDQFTDAMESAIDRGLRLAFAEGAADCGITPEDYTEDEQMALEEIVNNELGFVADLADAVEAGSFAKKGPLQALFDRSEMWILRYLDVVSRARATVCKDKKFKWTMGATEKHCRTCQALDGQVRRGSFWRSHVLPKNPENEKLECKGFKCECEILPTDEPVTRGSLPRLP
jgi:hypothetical protein